MYFGINKFSVSTSDHKPLHVYRIQQEVSYICILHHIIWILLNSMFMYYNLRQCNKVARYTVWHISFMMESQMNLMNSQRFIKVFPAKLCPVIFLLSILQSTCQSHFM